MGVCALPLLLKTSIPVGTMVSGTEDYFIYLDDIEAGMGGWWDNVKQLIVANNPVSVGRFVIPLN